MKRNDLRTLGLTPAQIDTVMKLNGDDINREKVNVMMKDNRETHRLRESCAVLLELLESPEQLKEVIRYISLLYTKQETPRRGSTDSGQK